jgi:DNA-binding transcriptional regulator YhcF (GntR family)
MHTVNKAYAVLREEGIIHLDRRRGAVVAVDINKLQALDDMRNQLKVVLAKGRCKQITKEEVFQLVEELFAEYY